MQKSESFHPYAIICDHFDLIKNQIDILTEHLIKHNQTNEDKNRCLNAIRNKQIAIIQEIQQHNLNLNSFDEEIYKKEWAYILNDTLLDYDQKVDHIKAKLISIDCIIIEDSTMESNFSLWITPWYSNQQSLQFLRL